MPFTNRIQKSLEDENQQDQSNPLERGPLRLFFFSAQLKEQSITYSFHRQLYVKQDFVFSVTQADRNLVDRPSLQSSQKEEIEVKTNRSTLKPT